MSHTIALVERDALQHELETVFDASTAGDFVASV